ncbi:MAG: M20/M25/M40 family metallo-hydrolase [Planctomycetota bacterium]|jgi:hypothetical protein
MNSFPTSLLFFLFILSAAAGAAEPKTDAASPGVTLALETIDGDDIYTYIDFLASNALFGRNAGTAGNDRAAEWIADSLKRMGLKPAGDDGTYFQRFTFRPRGTKGKKSEASNVLALLEGTDRKLKKEVVVVGAHFDHVGRKGHESNPGRLGQSAEGDIIWNGADDNASGTAGVIEIAQAFAFSRLKPSRSILFALFNAEEHGLHGSRHYVKHPAVPLENTVAMVNLDMIGRNAEMPVKVLGVETSLDEHMKTLALACVTDLPGITLDFKLRNFSGSDHGPFLRKRIPVAFFFTGLHRDYHHTTDEVDKIDCVHASKVSKAAFLLVHRLANRSERVAFNPDFRTRDPGLVKRKLLGVDLGKRVTLDELQGLGMNDDQGAVRIKRVHDDTPASAAGLEKGDLILSLGTIRIRSKEEVTSLKEAIDAAPLDVEIPLEIVRNNQILVVSVQLTLEE